jgi:hypothetical protein
MIMHRIVDNNEPLRVVAEEYGVSHETIRRILLLTRQQRVQQDA